MQNQHERTLRMMQEFLTLHAKGYSIKQIARRFDLDTVTVYRNLNQIVSRYNSSHPQTPITRESLLERPHAPHTGYERAFAPIAPIDLAQIREDIEHTMQDLNSLLTTMANDITIQEAFAQNYL